MRNESFLKMGSVRDSLDASKLHERKRCQTNIKESSLMNMYLYMLIYIYMYNLVCVFSKIFSASRQFKQKSSAVFQKENKWQLTTCWDEHLIFLKLLAAKFLS